MLNFLDIAVRVVAERHATKRDRVVVYVVVIVFLHDCATVIVEGYVSVDVAMGNVKGNVYCDANVPGDTDLTNLECALEKDFIEVQ